jgi:deoxyribodipyrimidine photo-lyase
LKDFQRWKTGTTGFPLVDAGMRQLNQTGYMHNRVRMVCASFLVKHLLIDWRRGERYFADKLIDYDLASNNGNWQWVAGCGTDAAPYFRIFNPLEQQKKFDPEEVYVSRWISEFKTGSYPKPIVDHKTAYRRAIEFFGKK